MAPIRIDSPPQSFDNDSLLTILYAINAFLIAVSLIFTVFQCCGGGEGGGGGGNEAPKIETGKVPSKQEQEIEKASSDPPSKDVKTIGKDVTEKASERTAAATEVTAKFGKKTILKSTVDGKSLASATAGPTSAPVSMTAGGMSSPMSNANTQAPSNIDETAMKTQAPSMAPTQVHTKFGLVSKTAAKSAHDYIVMDPDTGKHLASVKSTKGSRAVDEPSNVSREI